MRVARVVASALAALVLSSCKSVGPNFVPPQEAVPEHYAGAAPAGADGVAAVVSDAAPDNFWWRQFHDAELDSLEERAAAGNLDLQAAYLRMVAARIQVQSARAQGLPSLDASAKFTRDQVGAAGILKSQGVNTGGTSPATQGLIETIERPVNIYQAGFDASWELDLFGKVRRSVEAAEAARAGAVESRNDLLVSLQAEVAETYLQLRAGQLLRKITQDLIAAQQDALSLTQNRQQHGLAFDADVEAARAQLASLRSQLPPFDQSVAVSKHALAVLMGQLPETLESEFGATGTLPPLPAAVPVGIPSTLARRRPDIRNSEAALHEATAEVGVSVASLFPEISLTGAYGVRNLGTRYLFDWESKFYSFAPSVSIPIFHGGALIANVRLSRAQAAEAALNYRKTVFNALQEVEDGLSNLETDAARTAALRETASAEQKALDLDLVAYGHGLISYLNVLTVQIQTVQARQQLAQAQLSQAIDLVKLYKALGGGWASP